MRRVTRARGLWSAVAVMLLLAGGAAGASDARSATRPGLVMMMAGASGQAAHGRTTPGAADTGCVFLDEDTCASVDTSVTIETTSDGDTSGCTFTATADWGDGTPPTSVSFAGGPDGTLFDIGDHTYTTPGSYTINLVGVVDSGGCTFGGGTGYFTLTSLITSPAAGSIVAMTDAAYLSPQPTGTERAPTKRDLTVTGIDNCGCAITVNGVAAAATGTAWQAKIPVTDPGPLTVSVETAAGEHDSANITLIDLRVVNPAENAREPLTAAPAMPILDARAQAVGYPEDTSSQTLNWTLDLRGEYKDRSGWHAYPKTLVTGSAAGTQTPWNLPQGSPVIGGAGRLSVSANLPGVLDDPVKSEPLWINIPGANPGPAAVNSKIAELDAHDSHELRHLFCWESGARGAGYPQFNQRANSGEPAFTDVPGDWTPNPPVLQPKYGAPPAGIGIAQLDPAQFPGQQWDWTRNVAGGIRIYQRGLAASAKLLGQEQARLNSERNQAVALVKATRAAHHLKAIPPPPPVTVPAEPRNFGVAGVTADAITRFNTGSGWNLFYFNYHYLASPDNLHVLTEGGRQWVTRDGKWRNGSGIHAARSWLRNPSWDNQYVHQVMRCVPAQ